MTLKRSLSILLTLALLLGCMGWTPVQAEERENANANPAPSQVVNSNAEQSAEHPSKEDFIEHCEDSGIFRYIDEDTFRRADHVARLTEEESLNTFVFQNRDGTKSVYYMEEDVKYVAPDGSIRDRDITLVRAEKGYGVRDNNVNLRIPDSANDGIRVSRDRNSIRLIPLGGSGNAEVRDNSVVYADFYEAGTDLKYTPTLSGIKEDIILDAYNGVSSFVFLLETGGLYLYENAGQYYLAESETAEAAFYLGKIIVFDAIGRPSQGSMTVETVAQGQAYRLTISASVEFLTDPTTVYPVTIDPTITISDTTDEGMIEDSPVFSYYPDNNHGYGAFLYNSIGYTNATLGTGRTVFRFNGLLADEVFNSLDADYINKVEFFVRDAGTEGNYQVNIHSIQGNSTWTESTVTWNSVSSYSSTIYDSQILGYSYWSTFDITDLALKWKSGELNGQCGLIMVANDESQYIVTCSTDYTYSTLWPYVVVTYNPKISINCDSTDVQVNDSTQLIATTIPADMAITWNSSDTTIATVSNGVVFAHEAGNVTITASVTDEDGQTHTDTCTVHVYLADGVYQLQNQYSSCYIGVKNGEIANGSAVTQQRSVTLADQALQYYAQLWKVKHLGNGYYSIRPMHRLSSALCVPSGSVMIQDIGTEDTSVPDNAKWTICYFLTGYVIQCNGSSARSLSPYGLSQAADVAVLANTFTGSTPAYRWTLNQVTDIADTLLLIDTENNVALSSAARYVAPDETRTMGEMGLAVSFVSAGTNTQAITWGTVGATADAIAYSPTDKSVTGVSAGQTAILNYYVHRNGTLHTKSISMHVTALPEGTYLLKSKYSEKYVDIEDGTMAVNATVCQWDFTGADTQKWIFTHLDDGTYSICSANGATAYYLGVIDDSVENDQTVVLKTGTPTDGMKWKISLTTNGYFKLAPLTGEANDRVLAVEAGVLGNATAAGCELQQRDYVDDTNYKDEWFLHPLSTIQLDTPHISQKTGMWCWAASAQMMVRTLWPTEANFDPAVAELEQRNAVYYTFTNDASSAMDEYNWSCDPEGLTDNGGIYHHVVKAATYLTSIACGDTAYAGRLAPVSEDYLIHYLMNGYPVVRLYGSFDDSDRDDSISAEEWLLYILGDENTEMFSGHVTVIYGFMWDEDTKSYVFFVRDPNDAEIQMKSYAQLRKDTEQSTATYLWIPSAVVKTAYWEQAFADDIVEYLGE